MLFRSQTNYPPGQALRPVEVQITTPQPANPLQPADPYSVPNLPDKKPNRPLRVTTPPTARDITSNALKPVNPTVNLPPLPGDPRAATNTAPASVGQSFTNTIHQPLQPIVPQP